MPPGGRAGFAAHPAYVKPPPTPSVPSEGASSTEAGAGPSTAPPATTCPVDAETAAWKEEATRLRNTGAYADLASHARIRLSRFSADPMAQAYLGYALVGLKEYAQALGPLREGEKDASERRDLLMQRAFALRELGRAVETVPLYDRLMVLAPDDVEVIRAALSSPWGDRRAFLALRASHRLATKFPQDAGSWRELVRASFRVGHYAETAEAAGKALALDPTDHSVAVPQAQALARLGHDGAALHVLEEYLRERADDAEAWCDLGLLRLKEGKSDEAESALVKATHAEPGHVRAGMALGTLRFKQGKKAEAERSFAQVVEHDPKCQQGWYDLGIVRQELGKETEAASAFRRALSLDRADVRSASNLAVLLAKSGQMEEATLELEETAKFRPDAKDLAFNLGLVLKMQGKLDEAYLQFKRAHRLDPFDYESWQERARTLATIHKIDAANAEAWMALGRGFLRRQGFAEAHECFRRALEISPKTPEASRLRGESLAAVYQVPPTEPEGWLRTARMLVEMHQFADALDALAIVLALRPDDPDARVLTGRILLSMGRPDSALKQAELALKVAPSHPAGRALQGEAQLEAKMAQEALATFESLLAEAPNDPTLLTYKGTALSMLNRSEEALACFGEALRADPHFREAWNHQGAELERLGRYEEAVEAFSRGFR